MKTRILIFLFSLFILSSQAENRKNTCNLVLHIQDDKQVIPLEYAAVFLYGEDRNYSAISDENGMVLLNGIIHGSYKLMVSYVAYKPFEQTIKLIADERLTIRLTSTINSLNEVIVTASESRGITSSSVIDRKAMEHLQPSSFKDLLELLPGGSASDPALTAAQTIELRGVSISDSQNKYNTSSLGTSFVIDGSPISTNANMQTTAGPEIIINNGSYANQSRNTVNRGIDMRAISTDQIERVEIVRGIPSVKYGNLTSGLIKIERKKGPSKLEGRFKADVNSKLFALSKGFRLNENTNINIGLDFLDAKSSPTDSYTNYQRLNASFRLNREWNKRETSRLIWNSNVDFGHTLDDVKTDPDIGYNLTNKYNSGYNRFAWGNTLSWAFEKKLFLKKIELITSASYELDKIKQTKFVQLLTPTAIPNATEQGESDGIYLPANWISEQTIDGKPLSLFAQLTADMNVKTAGIIHNLLAGMKWTYDKNFGKGQIYDVNLPPSPDMTTRPRKYSDIPAGEELAFFVEDKIGIPVGRNRLQVNAGIRGMSIINLAKEYKMNEKWYFDPRLNAEWTFPAFQLKEKPLILSFSGGIGWHQKTPTLLQLYPDFIYNDHVQLNYYHNNPEFRRINLITYKNKIINYNLEPAVNRKWEMRLNLSYDNTNFSVTYFREKMTNGFRKEAIKTQSQIRKIYDQSAINSSELTGPPDLTSVPFETDTLLMLFSAYTNGSATLKEGVEFTLSTKRLDWLKTRMTVNGAWFRTNYDNSIPLYEGTSQLIEGKAIQEIGIYESTGGYFREQFNTNFMLDTYIPNLDLEFSTSFQCTWFYKKRTKPYSGVPFAYIDPAGNEHPYTEAEAEDTRLQWLIIRVNESQFMTEKVPFGMYVNFKMSKLFKDTFRISLFVNRILDYLPDYKANNVTIKRSSSPYFGAELTIKI